MSVTIPGVPTSIPKTKLDAMLADLGLSVDQLVSLRMDRDGVRAEVYAVDERGHFFKEPNADGVARHDIAIRIDWEA